MAKAYSPNGAAIIATAEIIYANAMIAEGSFRRCDHALHYNHHGETRVLWSTQHTEELDGKCLFVDEDGEMWNEDQIELQD